jgi:N-acetyl-gamma-glutamyl-phosphate reductase
MTRVGIIGASGYTGVELLRLCASHPELDVALATGDTMAGTSIAELYPSLAGGYAGRTFDTFDPGTNPEVVDGLDLVFLGLPHGASQALVPELRVRVPHVVDLAADFRLGDPAQYPTWYGAAHTAPEQLADFAYGLPELFRDSLKGAPAVAVPGCYPTAGSLALAPLVKAGAVQTDSLIVDAASGVSGAGRPPKANTSFCTVDEDFTAYGLLDHRHTPEFEQNLSTFAGLEPSQVRVLFTPHLAPMSRGILATCYARPTAAFADSSTAELLDLFHEQYDSEPFVTVIEGSPSTKSVLASNGVHVTARFDPRTGFIVAICAIDNLTKGASGGAVQCANLALGLDETTGLSAIGVFP